MGTCCVDNRKPIEESVIIFDDLYNLKEKIYKVFRLNSFHNYGSRRQVLLEKEFLEIDSKLENENLKVSNFFNTHSPKTLSFFEKNILNFTLKVVDKNMQVFINPEHLFLNIIMFVLSNTKNNFDKKQELIVEIINMSFFVAKNEQKIDLEKMKKYVKNLIQISINIFINFILLQTFETKENINKLIEPSSNFKIENKYDKHTISDFVFLKINEEINKNFSYSKLVEIWEEHLLAPIIFAGYSHDKNIANYNRKLREEIIKKFVDIFDPEKIINSFVKMKVE